VKIDTDVPKYVFADELRLKQVLVNLLSNAIKFTNKGTIQIKISLIKTYKDSRVQLRFSVKDRGIGISAENQQKIFEAFTQEDASTTKRFGGTGLGLTISNKILALMESKLHVDSHLGKGSLFYFDVVFRASYDEDNTLDDIEHIKHALIVDDNPTSRKLLKDLLALKKITYTEVKNGIEALQIIKENTEVFDVIFMDYQMPYLNGLETIGYFRENYSNYDTPIILLNSMLNDEKINESVKQLDIEQVLMKPISFKSLYAALSKISAKKQDFDKKIPVHKDAFTIIIAEDNNVNITLTETIIKNIYPNATILLASNGREALTLFKLHQPDLIFMDIQMPVMNGYNATKAIKSLEEVHQTPVIALTGGVLKGEVENCLKAGMDDYIPKPITKNKIQSMILKWLQKSKNIKGKSKVVHQEVNNEMRYNLKELYDKIDQDEAFLNIILKKTKTYWDNILSTLNVALENDDLVEVKQIAHKLKGSSLNLCFNKLASLASKIEKYEGNNMNTVSQYIDTIDEEINFLKEKIFVEKGMQN
ncbi:MAG: response regulator, partial [Bacteroidota bacterium]